MLACTVLAVPLLAAGYGAAKAPPDSQRGTPREAETAIGLRTVPDVGLRAATDRAGRHGETDASRFQGHSAAYWHWRFTVARRIAYQRGKQVKRLARTMMSRPSVTEAIDLAAVTYGQSAWFMRSLAYCESTLQADPPHNNVNRGLFQFNPGTFGGTPYGRFSILSPYANALAAGWMLRQGRRSEWAC